MSNISKLKEKQLEEHLDRLVGNADPALREILKLTMTNTEVTDEIKHALNRQQEANLYEAVTLEQELEMTMDARGNIVPINGGVEKQIVMGGSAPSAIETSNHRKPDGYKSINFSGAIIIQDGPTTANI